MRAPLLTAAQCFAYLEQARLELSLAMGGGHINIAAEQRRFITRMRQHHAAARDYENGKFSRKEE